MSSWPPELVYCVQWISESHWRASRALLCINPHLANTSERRVAFHRFTKKSFQGTSSPQSGDDMTTFSFHIIFFLFLNSRIKHISIGTKMDVMWMILITNIFPSNQSGLPTLAFLWCRSSGEGIKAGGPAAKGQSYWLRRLLDKTGELPQSHLFLSSTSLFCLCIFFWSLCLHILNYLVLHLPTKVSPQSDLDALLLTLTKIYFLDCSSWKPSAARHVILWTPSLLILSGLQYHHARPYQEDLRWVNVT